MKVVFLGTSEFALPSLEALVLDGHQMCGVVTQPDRRCGRGRKMSPSQIKVKAQELSLSVWQPERANQPDFLNQIQALAPDVLVVAAYGQILRRKLLSIPRIGCINVHASLLPAYRGADPIRWALVRGEKKTGVTIMMMDEGVDTGPILRAETTEILASDNCQSLTDRLGRLGSRLLVETISLIENNQLSPRQQDEDRATYAPVMKRSMVQIDWRLPARDIVNRVRAFSPCPGACAHLNRKRIHILEAALGTMETDREPGTIIEIERERGITVATGNGVVHITHLKPESKKTLYFRDFCCGYRIEPGASFTVEPQETEG